MGETLEAREAAQTVRLRWVWGGIVAAMLIFSVAMGFALRSVNSSADLPKGWDVVSGIIGWMYFAAWSVSFYPQVVQNFVRRSVVGLSFDYQGYNLLGFAAYSAYNLALFWNSGVRAEYRRSRGGNVPVDANDVFFALHALLLTVITVAQCFVFERGSQRVSVFASVVLSAGTTASVVYAALVAAGAVSATWLDFLLFVSYIKLAVSLIKYIPQAYLNFARRTTDGFNIYNVLLDFTGGMLSVAQLLLDSGLSGDWSGISGDPVKFGLGLCSMVFDSVFMVQHYILFPGNNAAYFRARDALEDLEDEDDAEELRRHLTEGSLTKDLTHLDIKRHSVRTVLEDAQRHGRGVQTRGCCARPRARATSHEDHSALLDTQDTGTKP